MRCPRCSTARVSVIVRDINPPVLVEEMIEQRVIAHVPGARDLRLPAPGSGHRGTGLVPFGERALRRVADAVAVAAQAVLPRSRPKFFQVYGMTEVSGAVTCSGRTTHDDTGQRGPAALGRAAVARRRDRRGRPGHRRALAAGEVGELWVRTRAGDGRLLGQAARRPPRRSSSTAGCAPATSASSTRTATSTSPTGSRT